MMKRIACVAAFLVAAVTAHAQPAEQVGMAVRLHNYARVRRLVGEFLTQIIPDYYHDMPDQWLAPILNDDGMTSINQRGDFCLLAVDTQEGVGWAMLAPVTSRGLYLDAIRAYLGRETKQDGARVFTVKEVDGKEAEKKFYVRVVGRTAAASYNAAACKAAVAMLENDQVAQLFKAGYDAPIQVRIANSFIKKHREQLYLALLDIQLLGLSGLGPPNATVLAESYTKDVVAAAQQIETLHADITPAAGAVSVRLTIRPRPGTLLAALMAAQQPMKSSLLDLLPGEPVFACAGRVESLDELQMPYADLTKRLFTVLPKKVALAGMASKLAAERLQSFSSVFAGHFAAALVQPPDDSFGVDYLRVYEVNDPAGAKDGFARAIAERAKLRATVKPLPESEHAGHNVLAYKIAEPPPAGKKPDFATVCAAFVDKFMLVASGKHSEANIRKMIDACAGKPSAPAVAKAPCFVAGTADAPKDASAAVFFSLTGFLHWAGQSDIPGIAQLREIGPANGIAAWLVPGEGAFSIFLRLPADEFVELRKALLGDSAILTRPPAQ
ncbi:MAG: hypothetical protein HQ592_08845 [Planctomycetes bacterium]|nr:hypothetical protein [Planctomycetota bacterium]